MPSPILSTLRRQTFGYVDMRRDHRHQMTFSSTSMLPRVPFECGHTTTPATWSSYTGVGHAPMNALAAMSQSGGSQTEGTMMETPKTPIDIDTPQIDHVPEDESRALPATPPKLETPVIQSQDIEHQPRPETRMSNKGIKVTPHLDSDDDRDFAREDEEALKAMEEIERQYRKQVPG